jgi:uncharacterized protein (DUF2249 family)
MNLELQKLDSELRREKLISAYKELPQGQGLSFLSDNSESQLLAHFQKIYPGGFEWYTLEEGPEHWLVVVSKRTAAASHHRQIMEFMEADHRRFYALIDQVALAVRSNDTQQALKTLIHLETGLRKHIQMEEEILLPVVALRLISPRGPAMVLREEHIRVLELVGDLQRRCGTVPEDGKEWVGQIEAAIEEFNRTFHNHTGIEERILYAVTDLILNEQERNELVNRCQAI